MRAKQPQSAAALLGEATLLARQLEGLRESGRALSEIYAALFPIDEAAAIEGLAGLRSLGRTNFLDGIDAMLVPVTERYGAELAWQMVEALETADTFFK